MFKFEEYEGFTPVGFGDSIGCEELSFDEHDDLFNEEEWI